MATQTHQLPHLKFYSAPGQPIQSFLEINRTFDASRALNLMNPIEFLEV